MCSKVVHAEKENFMRLTEIPQTILPESPSLQLKLETKALPESRARAYPKAGVVEEPVTIHRYGTLRVHGATHRVTSISLHMSPPLCSEFVCVCVCVCMSYVCLQHVRGIFCSDLERVHGSGQCYCIF